MPMPMLVSNVPIVTRPQQKRSNRIIFLQINKIALAINKRTLQYLILMVQLARVAPLGCQDFPEELDLSHAGWELFELFEFGGF